MKIKKDNLKKNETITRVLKFYGSPSKLRGKSHLDLDVIEPS